MSREPWWHFLHKEEAGKVYFLLIFLFITSIWSGKRLFAIREWLYCFMHCCGYYRPGSYGKVMFSCRVCQTVCSETPCNQTYTRPKFVHLSTPAIMIQRPSSWPSTLTIQGPPNCNYDPLTYSNLFTWTSPYRYPLFTLPKRGWTLNSALNWPFRLKGLRMKLLKLLRISICNTILD